MLHVLVVGACIAQLLDGRWEEPVAAELEGAAEDDAERSPAELFVLLYVIRRDLEAIKFSFDSLRTFAVPSNEMTSSEARASAESTNSRLATAPRGR